MSWAKAVKKLSSGSFTYDGDNSEGWVPSRSSYPHVHFGKDFIRYRHAHGAGGSVLADGQHLLAPIHDVLKEATGDAQAALQALVDNY